MSLFPEDAAPAGPPAYRVLARKYRPSDFASLIGQEAMVQTLANAIRSNRLAQAWLLTGVRGVGKTSTARIIARCLNCTGPDGTGGPTITPCGTCDACVQIAAGTHIDVIEMDAASNTGVDNVREIIEAVRYATVSARYRVYIIDEVHMLSKGAFNALLKTLEEPPPHVKFVLATTEVDKVPATILSRCQRFDLRRVPVAQLEAHFAQIARAEGVAAEPEALRLIARAAEGSVRDGLSILDQAIAMGGGRLEAEPVRALLGLAGRGRVTRLLAAIVAGEAPAALAELDSAHEAGADPLALLRDLLDLVHQLTRARLGGALDVTLSEADRATLAPLLDRLGFPALHRLWQLLLKGHQEVAAAPDPAAAAAMAVLRAVHAAGLPGPEELVALLAGADLAPGARAPASPPPAPPAPASPPPSAASPPAPPAAVPADFRALVALVAERNDPQLARLLTDKVACLAFESGTVPARLVLRPLAELPRDVASGLARQLEAWTGVGWDIRLDAGARDGMSLLQEAEARAAAQRDLALADPTVRALLEGFPEARLVEVVPAEDEASEAGANGQDDDVTEDAA